jgi:carbon monoxide dehydrogenase subunit G
MELKNSFTVATSLEEAWAVLTDVERIAPCLPGAELTEVEGEEYRGTVKVKVGPITAQYKGTARLTERDESAHRAVLEAKGRDTRGQGNAEAKVVAELADAGDGRTRVDLVTDLTVTGKVAQFGRGVLADVSNKLLSQFVDNLEREVLGLGKAPSAPAEDEAAPSGAEQGGTEEAPSGPRRIASRPAEPVDLLEAAGPSVAKRVAPVAGGALVLLVVLWLLRRARR